MVSLPSPPSSVSGIRLARPLPAVMTSSPPPAWSTRFSVVPMSSENGAGADAVEAHARAVRRDGEGLGAVAAVDLGGVVAVAALEEVGAAAGVPDHAGRCRPGRTSGRRRCRRSAMSLPSPPNSRSLPPLPLSVSLPAWPNSRSLPEPPVSVSLPSPPKMCAAGSAPLASSTEIVSLPPWPKCGSRWCWRRWACRPRR